MLGTRQGILFHKGGTKDSKKLSEKILIELAQTFTTPGRHSLGKLKLSGLQFGSEEALALGKTLAECAERTNLRLHVALVKKESIQEVIQALKDSHVLQPLVSVNLTSTALRIKHITDPSSLPVSSAPALRVLSFSSIVDVSKSIEVAAISQQFAERSMN